MVAIKTLIKAATQSGARFFRKYHPARLFGAVAGGDKNPYSGVSDGQVHRVCERFALDRRR